MAPQATELACPECAAAGVDKSFGTAQALGAHRNRSHGVAGKNAKKNKRQPQQAQPVAAVVKTPRKSLDRNKLLGLIFPDGIPAKAEMLTEIEKLLQDAARLSRVK